MVKKKFEVSTHTIVPKHEKLSEKDKKELFEKYNISNFELPKILAKDASIEHLKLNEGDIVKITRSSPTIVVTTFYRSVING